MNMYLIRAPYNYLKDSESVVRTLKMIHEAVGRQLLYTRKQLQKFVNWWLQTVDLPLKSMEDQLHINQETKRPIIYKDLKKRRICTKTVPHSRTDELILP